MTAAPHMAEALKSCPFCGESMIPDDGGHEHPHSDECPLDSLYIENRTVAAWDRRAPDEKDAEIDVAAIEASTTRWHGEATEHFSVRWEPYKPDGQRQMKAKGRWQRAVASGDYWRWANCDRPSNIKPATPT